MPSKKAAKKSWYEKIVCLYNAFFFGEIGASFLACLTTVICFANSKRKKAWQKKKRRDVGYRRPHPRHLLKKVDENNRLIQCEHTYKSQFVIYIQKKPLELPMAFCYLKNLYILSLSLIILKYRVISLERAMSYIMNARRART